MKMLVVLGLSFICSRLNYVGTHSSAVNSNHVGLELFDESVKYDVDSSVLINDAGSDDKEIGYKIKATLHAEPIWRRAESDGELEVLLKLKVSELRVWARGAARHSEYQPRTSPWDGLAHTHFLAHWHNGRLLNSYMHSDDRQDIINYKRSLLSLFQFKLTAGEHNETDVSGACSVLYEPLSANVIRKIKRGCDEDGPLSGDREARYTLGERGGLLGVLVEERYSLRPLTDAPLGLGASVRVLMVRAPHTAPLAPREPSLSAALQRHGAGLRSESGLRLEPEDASDEESEGFSAALEGAREGLAQGDARSVLRVTAALAQGASDDGSLRRALRDTGDRDLTSWLTVCAGASGSSAALEAVRAELQPDAPEHRRLLRQYLAALSTATGVGEDAVRSVLRMSEGEGETAEAALLAAGALGARAATGAVREHLARRGARCGGPECRELTARALANLRSPDAAESLLQRAEAGGAEGEAGAALAALDALGALPAGALSEADSGRLLAVASSPMAPEVRAAALELALRSAGAPALSETAMRLHAAGPPELRRLFWQLLRSRAPELARLVLLERPELRNWHAQAHSGTSSAMRRELGGAGGVGGALGLALDSVQLAAGGVLRRGRVELHARGRPLLALELRARGLGAEEDGEEGARGELALEAGGARLPVLVLFAGRGELLGHVWAGTASEPTPVLAHAMLHREAGAAPTAAGVRLHAGARGAVVTRLTARAQVSLWNRAATAAVELRGETAWEGRLKARGPGATLEGLAEVAAGPALTVEAELDFYDRVSLCVEARQHSWPLRHNATLTQTTDGARQRVRRALGVRVLVPGLTLALDRDNDRACRRLRDGG